MAHYNTRYSSVSPSAMHAAVCKGTAILGRDRARLALLGFVDPETVIVVHGGSGDFGALRWIHPLVVDTFILEGYEGPAVDGQAGRSLKELCRRKVGIEVQVRDRANGKLGHDSLEDAMATRELLLAWMKSIPEN
jgi:RNA exonuclease 1